MNRILTIFYSLVLALLICPSALATDSPLWLRYPAISPDGKTVAFCYRGDIFLVPTEGGQARQLTTHAAYDYRPIWSPDSQSIAFASTRDGAMDVFIVPASGGTPKRLTHFTGVSLPNAFTPDGKHVLYNSIVTQDKDYGQFPYGQQVYSVSVDGDRPSQFLSFNALNICFDKTGTKYLYHNHKGYENEWRKHHKSSITRDIWLHDTKSGTFTNLTEKQVEDRHPNLSADGQTVYFLSERFGSFNLCQMSLSKPSDIKPLTQFDKHPVRFLTRSDEDLLCFFYDGEIYTMKPDGTPQKLAVSIIADNQEPAITKHRATDKASEIAVSPNGKEFAFIVRGDVFVAHAEHGVSKRITNTAALECNVQFSPDGRSLVYASQRDGQWNIYIASLADEFEQAFCYADEIKEEQMTTGDRACFQARFSPTGKEIAYLQDRTQIMAMDVATKKSRIVLPARYNYSYEDGDQSYEWSPDGKWIIAQFFEEGGWHYSDIALVKADGSQEYHNLINSGYADTAPRWAMGGKAIIWASDRMGMRNHGSWGTQDDVYATFIDKESFENFRLNKEERAFAQAQKDKEDAIKAKNDPEAAKAQADDNKDADNKEELPELKIELKDFEKRTIRLTINSTSLQDMVLTQDGKKLFYIAGFEKGSELWLRDFEENSTKRLGKLEAKGKLSLSKDGKSLYLLAGDKISIINQENAELKPLKYQAEVELKHREERDALFNYIWQQIKDRFYDASFEQVDWAYYKQAYQRFLPHINNEFDFTELASEMLGELNTSHTGAFYEWKKKRAATATLGAFYDTNYDGDGLKIAEIMEGGPLDDSSGISAGMIIQSIDQKPIKKGEDYYQLLEGKGGKRVRLGILDPATGKSRIEFVKALPHTAEKALLYERWVKQRAKMVEELSGGQLGYIHIKKMDSPSFRETYSELLGKNRNKKAVVIDTRFNGGGWLHGDLAVLFSGKKYAEFLPRGQSLGIDPIAQWTKPSIVLMCEGNYSNAHGFPWVYKELNIGKLVGTPVPGTMTAVWYNEMPNGVSFGIPEIGMKDNKGRYLENLQLEPDIEIYNSPEEASKNIDKQLEAAVKALMQEVEGKQLEAQGQSALKDAEFWLKGYGLKQEECLIIQGIYSKKGCTLVYQSKQQQFELSCPTLEDCVRFLPAGAKHILILDKLATAKQEKLQQSLNESGKSNINIYAATNLLPPNTAWPAPQAASSNKRCSTAR